MHWAQQCENRANTAMSVCLSVHMEQLGSHWTEFCPNWYWRPLYQNGVDRIQIWSKSDENKRYFTITPASFMEIYRSLRNKSTANDLHVVGWHTDVDYVPLRQKWKHGHNIKTVLLCTSLSWHNMTSQRCDWLCCGLIIQWRSFSVVTSRNNAVG